MARLRNLIARGTCCNTWRAWWRWALARYLGQQVQARRDAKRAAAGLPALWTTAEWETVLTRVLNRVDWQALAETIIRDPSATVEEINEWAGMV